MTLLIKTTSAAAVALSAMMLTGAVGGAKAATCTATSEGTINLFLQDGCQFPAQTEEKVFLDRATGVTAGTANVGSKDGMPEVSLSSSTSLNIANGFATVKGADRQNISDLTFSVPGYSFEDLVVDIKLATFGTKNNKRTYPLSIEGFNGTTSLGLLDYTVNALKGNANLSLMILATAENLTSVVFNSVLNGNAGIRQFRHFQVSGLEQNNVTPVTSVPVPAPLALLVSGLVGLLFLGRGRKRSIS